MKIKSNKTFDCYETAHESWNGGKDITLDGVRLVPVTVLDKIIAEIEQKIKKRPRLNHTRAERERNDAFLEVLDIINKYKAEMEVEE